MLRTHIRLAGAAATVLAAGAITVSGLTPAMATPTVHPAVAGTALTGQPAVSATERFQLVTSSATSQDASFIATGVFTAGGVDHQGDKSDTIALPGGTFKIEHSPGQGSQTFDPRTCLLSINEHGNYQVVAGTGRYAGISGHGRYQFTLLMIAARSHGTCSKTQEPVAFQQIITGSGPVHL